MKNKNFLKKQEELEDSVLSFIDKQQSRLFMEVMNKIVADLKWLAEKAEDPIVKISYGMAVTIVELHFGELGKNEE